MKIPSQLKNFIRRELLCRGIAVSRSDRLTMLADRYQSDKGNLFDAHGYTRIYQRLFSDLRHRPINFVELGLHRPDADGRRDGNGAQGVTHASATKAPSLEMWRDFFPRANIFGFDIDDFSAVVVDRCKIVRGDMSSPGDLDRLLQTISGPVDVVIDDGSHASHHQQLALGHLFSHMSSGGIYIIEDLWWQPVELEQSAVPKTRDLLRAFQVTGLFESPLLSREQRQCIEQTAEKVMLFDSLTGQRADTTDSLAVLVKK